MPNFFSAHNHTIYSMLDGFSRMDVLAKKAKEIGYPALAITDHGNMSGAVKFHNACKKEKVRPIIGQEFYLAPGRIADRERRRYHLTILAKNLVGYRNLCRLSSAAYLDGFYYFPRVDKELLMKYREGLLCFSGCVGGEVANLIWQGKHHEAMQAALAYRRIFGDDFYIEIWNTRMQRSVIQERVLPQLIQLARALNIKMKATCDSHYTEQGDAFHQEILMTMGQGASLRDPLKNEGEHLEGQKKTRLCLDGDYHIMSHLEMATLGLPEKSLDMSDILTKIQDYEIQPPKGTLFMPEITDVKDTDEWLREMCHKALPKKYKNPSEKVKERLEYELSVITGQGYSSYFYVIHDVISWAKRIGIGIGPGRGSAASSIVSYLLNISMVDPIEYGLVFERFLNPDRISPPDIDFDIEDLGRQAVIDYARQKYGEDRVCQILTVNRMGTKSSIRDVGRVMNVPVRVCQKLSSLIPESEDWKIDEGEDKGKPKTIAHAIEEIPEFKQVLHSELNESEAVSFADACKAVEGTNKSISLHAGGIVITPGPLTDFLPVLRRAGKGPLSTQYEMDGVEGIGLIKFDFLGLRTLRVIAQACKAVGIRVEDIPFDDEKTYELLGTGNLGGVFQLESSGMAEFVSKMKPKVIMDVINAVALYRPGPMESGDLERYMKVRSGAQEPEYDVPELEPILSYTLGACIYQEDVIRIAMVVGGFTASVADELRYGIGKKQQKKVDALYPKFIKGFQRITGHSEEEGHALFEKMKKFGRYGFNIAHAASYGFLAYQTAWLKANHLEQFYAAHLNSKADKNKTLKLAVADAKLYGVKILPPDINTSGEEFTAVGPNEIRFGLRSVKNVGEKAVKSILEERESGPFESVDDFVDRIPRRNADSRVRTALARVGAFDAIHNGTRGFVENLLIGRKTSPPNYSMGEILEMEFEYLGLFLSGHPLRYFGVEVDSRNAIQFSEIQSHAAALGGAVVIAGVVCGVRDYKTSQGVMAFVELEDEAESRLNIIVFAEKYAAFKPLLKEGKSIYVYGKIQHRRGNIEMVAVFMGGLGTQPIKAIHVERDGLPMSKLATLSALAEDHPGDIPIIFHVCENGQVKSAQESGMLVSPGIPLDRIGEILDRSRVKLEFQAVHASVGGAS